MESVINQFSVFAFSGSRSCPDCIAAVRGVLPLVPAASSVLVGDCSGVDACVRAAFRHAHVFYAACYGGILPRRSCAVVEACVEARGLFCAFPSGKCPASVKPSRSVRACFNGSGSGSWASLALAVGYGSACLVCVHPHMAPSWLVLRAVWLGGSYWFVQAQTVPTEIFSPSQNVEHGTII